MSDVTPEMLRDLIEGLAQMVEGLEREQYEAIAARTCPPTPAWEYTVPMDSPEPEYPAEAVGKDVDAMVFRAARAGKLPPDVERLRDAVDGYREQLAKWRAERERRRLAMWPWVWRDAVLHEGRVLWLEASRRGIDEAL